MLKCLRMISREFTRLEQKAFRNATTCWICQEALVKDRKHKDYKNKRPVRYHCHFTGKYRGAAHSICNLLFRKPNFTPIKFHNLSGYDSHLFIKNLGKTEGKIKCIPNNEERYITFSKVIRTYNYTDKETGDAVYKDHKMRFIDSFRFMSSSLDVLISNLTACGKCDSCKPGDCLKRYVEGGKLIQYKGIGSCDRCKNCQLVKKSCLKLTTKRLRETSKILEKELVSLRVKVLTPMTTWTVLTN